MFLHIVFSFQNIVQVEEKMVEEKETSNTEVASSDDEEEIEFDIGKFLSSMNMSVTYCQINRDKLLTLKLFNLF